MASEKKGWFEERLGLNSSFSWLLNRKVPGGVGWWYVLGSATMIVFIILVVTGIFMMMNYSPSPDHAYDSIQFATTQVAFANLIRSIHFYAASAMIILVVLHLIRVYFMAAYRYPRELTWVIGAILLILVLGSSFTGYLLPWDQRAYWATNVASGIAGSVPLIGHWAQKVLLGGSQIGTETLTRFFTFHVAVIPALIGALIGLHLFLVIRQGISAPPGRMKIGAIPGQDQQAVYEAQYQASKKGGESFFPDTIARDTIFSVLIVAIIIGLAVAFPHASEAPADPTSTTYNPTPEWYFLFLFQFLKFFPGWLEPVAAVVIPGLALLVLITVPFIDRGIGRFWRNRKPALAVGGVVAGVLVILEVWGALSAPTRPQGADNQLALDGQTVYRSVNCAYCHSINGVGGAIGPDLSNIASTLTKDQITSYLQNPDLMVPNTLHPKLQFTPDELNALVAYLETLGPPVVYSPQAPQLFSQNCAVCHTLNGVGGKVGPDLSNEGSHRSVDFLQSFITDPRSVVPGTTMRAFGNVLTPNQIQDIAAYLFSQKGQTPSPTPPTTSTPQPTVTPSLTPTSSPTATHATPSTPGASVTPTLNASQLYGANCAVCHGANREGGVGPAITNTALANWNLSQITNIISNGGEGGMPDFSNLLSPEQINALASFLKNGAA
jgi:ubiquinol-cytochrome c reductase cytochrome b subunit